MPERPARVVDALLTAQVAHRVRHAKSLIMQGRVWMDGVKVTRVTEGVPPGKHTITVQSFGGDVKIAVSGYDDFRV